MTPRQVRTAPAWLADFQRLLTGTLGIPLAWPEWLRATMR